MAWCEPCKVIVSEDNKQYFIQSFTTVSHVKNVHATQCKQNSVNMMNLIINPPAEYKSNVKKSIFCDWE